jgi:hypothetical protein
MLNNHLKFPAEKQLSQFSSAYRLLGKDNEYATFDQDALAVKCVKDCSHNIVQIKIIIDCQNKSAPSTEYIFVIFLSVNFNETLKF